MINFQKKPVKLNEIQPLCSRFNISQILASVFVRRGITSNSELLFFLEDNLRFQHSPFCFCDIEDAVERIIQAKEEGEKILIFGDSDVDGITSTAILYDFLVKFGCDVKWRLPVCDDAYGLSMTAVDDFANEGGSLIITVDCGISNVEETKHAMQLGIDVIITDHHNPQKEIPPALFVLDPKIPELNYPFAEISGAAVAYKLVSAIRFSQSDFYNAEICLFNISENTEQKCYDIDCLKIKNLVKIKELHEKIIPEKTSIYDLKLPYFLQGQLIYCWDVPKTQKILRTIFGNGIEFNLHDLKKEISSIIHSLGNKSIEQLENISVTAKYCELNEKSSVNTLYNLYVTYCQKIIANKNPQSQEDERKDLQLVALAALADIMPMKNENRIFVKNGILSMKKDLPRPGLAELFNRLKINLDELNSTVLSWQVIPALNAAGRLGKSNLSLQLLLSQDPKEREQLANTIFDLNEERKNLVSQAYCAVQESAKKSFTENQNKLCLCYDECINKGVTGLVANKLMQDFNVPAIAISFCDDGKSEPICVGSIRTCRGFIATNFLEEFGDFFINHGGHDCAAGFSFHQRKLPLFIEKTKEFLNDIQLVDEGKQAVSIDAQLPVNELTPEVFKILDLFEPFGAENNELVFYTPKIKLCDVQLVGKKEPMHLKLTFETDKHKIVGMFWSQGERFGKDIKLGQYYDILYNMTKNYYNGFVTNQIIIKDLQLSDF